MRRTLTLKKFVSKGLTATAVFVLFLALIFLLLVVTIHIPFVQQGIRDRVVEALQEKLGTTVGLQRFGLSLTGDVVLQNIYVEDEQKDTLFYAEEIDVNVNLVKLFSHQIKVKSLHLLNSRAFINRTPNDSSFNFGFIQKAFDSPQKESIDTSSSTWGFSLGRLALTDSKIVYLDSLAGDYANATLGSLTINVDTLNADVPRISLNQIRLSSTNVNILQTKLSKEVASSNPESQLDFNLDKLSLHDVEARYHHTQTGTIIRLDLGDFSVISNYLNVANREIRLEEISLLNTFVGYHEATSKSSGYDELQNRHDKSDNQTLSDEQPAWLVTLDRLSLINNSVQYYNFNIPPHNGFDVNHFWVSRLNAQAKNIKLSGRDIAGTIDYLSLRDKNGFELSSLQTSLALTDTTMFLHDFNFRTPETKILMNAHAGYASLSALSSNYEDTFIDIDLDSSIISARDIHYFIPGQLQKLSVRLPDEEKIRLTADVSGLLRRLSIKNFSVGGLTKTNFKANGHIDGLPRNDATLDLNLEEFHTTKEDAAIVLPELVSKAPLNLPEWITLNGSVHGTIDSPKLKALLKSNVGKIGLAAELNQISDSVHGNFQVDLNINNLELGELTGQAPTIGAVSLTAHVDGSGLTMKQVNALVDLRIDSLVYQGYTYKDFKANGRLDSYFFSGDASLTDKNLAFAFNGELDYRRDVPKYIFVFRLIQADFQALNLSERPLKARGNIEVNLSTADFKILNGTVDVRDVSIFNGDVLYRVDSMLFASIDQKGKTKITIRSDIISGDFDGTINIYSVGAALKEHFRYYTKSPDAPYDPVTPPQNFKFNLQLKNTDLLTEVIVPKLQPFVPGEINGEFSSSSHSLDIRFNIAKVQYAALGVDSIDLKVKSDNDSMNYSLRLKKISVDTLRMESLVINGNLSPQGIESRLVILDSLQVTKYAARGIFKKTDSATRFHLLPEGLILNGNNWKTPQDNSLTLSSEGMEAHNFNISRDSEKISVVTDDPNYSALVVISRLNLRSITSLNEGSVLADGILSGTLQFAPHAINSSAEISDLEIGGISWGDLTAELRQKSQRLYQVDLHVDGKNANMLIDGTYQQDSLSPTLEATAEIRNMNLKIIQPFTRRQIDDVTGTVYGKLKFSNSGNTPVIAGNLGFRNTTLTPVLTNSSFHLDDETVLFENQNIILRDFKIRDKSNNLATLKGTIRTDYRKTFNLNLDLTARNFQLLNTSEEDNDLYYGKIAINATARIAGELSRPQIQLNVSLQNDSKLTYVIPQSEKGALEQQGIVVFVDKSKKDDPLARLVNPEDTVNTKFRGIELTGNIELDDQETFSIVIDPISGDELTVKGNSTLTLDIDPSGNMSLSGRYEITEGTYDFTFYKFVKRKFSLEKGSNIIWSGDPLDATMDIRAIYEVDASPLELVSNQIPTTNPQELRQRMPFLVYLRMKGDLRTPEISFQLDMPDDHRNAFGGAIYAKIKDINTRESDLNKQVFALLILKRFISDNPFKSQGENDFSNTARRSVSRLLTEQLNRLTENIKGVQLTFDVKSYEDYSSGQAQGQTKLQLGLSKQLLNDRLVVKVSGNVDIEGDKSNQNSLTQFIGDLALEYKITPDGRLRITGFRNSDYDLIDGELIETGAGLIYIKDYDTLRELFNANAVEK